MKSKKILKLTVVILGLMGIPLSTLASIKYIQSNNGVISEIEVGAVISKCGKHFVYRELESDSVLPYLHREIKKARFKGELSPSLTTVISTLKSSSGKCSWVTEDEFNKL